MTRKGDASEMANNVKIQSVVENDQLVVMTVGNTTIEMFHDDLLDAVESFFDVKVTKDFSQLQKQRNKKQMYLVTDPCYIVPNDEWQKFVDDSYKGNFFEPPLPYIIKGFGKIVECDSTANGDGTQKVAKDKEVNVDSGTVCLVELEDGVTPTDYQGTATTDDKGLAEHYYERALQI